MTFRFLHLADLHLDSVYGGTPSTVKRLREATQEALVSAASFALDHRLDAVLIAGDAFDDDRLGFEARGVLRRELQRLARGGVTVVYCTGNHDPGTTSGRAAGLGLADLRGHGRSEPMAAASARSAPLHFVLDGKPQLLSIPRHGTSEPAALVITAGHDSSRVTANLVQAAYESLGAELERQRGLGGGPSGGGPRLPAVGLFHTQVASAGGAEGHEPYAPSSLGDFAALDLDYAALGHVHVRGRVDPSVPAYYAGNLVGRNAREHGPKGGLYVELSADGLEDAPEFVPFAPVEFFRCAVQGRSVQGRSARSHEEAGDDQRELVPESIAAAIVAALDEARAEGRAPAANEIIIRADLTDAPHRQTIDSELEAAALDEIRCSPALASTEVLELQLRRSSTASEPSSAGGDAQRRRDLIARLRAQPSALGASLAECLKRDAADGTRLTEALLARLSHAGPAR